MLVFPCGSDANIQHRPQVTLIAAGLCALVTLVTWINWPRAIIDGPIYIVHADEIRAWEKLERELPADPEQAADQLEKEVRRSWATELRHQVGLDGTRPQPMSPSEKLRFRSMVDDAVNEGELDGVVRDELVAALPRVPEVSDAYQQLAWLTVNDDPILEEQARRAAEVLAQGKADGSLTVAEIAFFSARLAARRVVSLGYLELQLHMDGEDAGRPISVEERDRLVKRADELASEGRLKPDERAEFLAFLDKRPVVSEALARLEHCTAAEVPWFMTPFGAWSWPWTWLISTFVHCHWRDALINIGLLWSFGLVVEGKLGWRRFLPVLGVGLLGTGLITMLSGLAAGVVLPVCGAHDLVGFLAGICLVWAPMNDIHYRRWLGVTLGEFETPIWVILAFSVGVNVVIGFLVGFPVLSVLLISLGYPLFGAAVGTVLLRRGLVETDGWDIYAWWRTRHVSTSERNQQERERRYVEKQHQRVSEPSQDDGALIAAMAEELTADLAASKGNDALAAYRLLRQRWPSWKAQPAQLDRLARLLWKDGRAEDAAKVAEDLVAIFPEAVDARIMLAATAVEARKPATAARHLDALPAMLKPTQDRQRELLRDKLADLERNGVQEVEFL